MKRGRGTRHQNSQSPSPLRSSFTLSPILSTDFSSAAGFFTLLLSFSRSVPESGMNVPARPDLVPSWEEYEKRF